VLSQVFSIEERGRDLFDAAERLDLVGIVASERLIPTDLRVGTVRMRMANIRAYNAVG
jgi:hypothetical protein